MKSESLSALTLCCADLHLPILPDGAEPRPYELHLDFAGLRTEQAQPHDVDAIASDMDIIIQEPGRLQCGLPGFCSMTSKTRRLQVRIRLRGAAQTAVRRDEKRKHEAIERGGRPRPADSKQKVPEPVQYDR